MKQIVYVKEGKLLNLILWIWTIFYAIGGILPVAYAIIRIHQNTLPPGHKPDEVMMIALFIATIAYLIGIGVDKSARFLYFQYIKLSGKFYPLANKEYLRQARQEA